MLSAVVMQGRITKVLNMKPPEVCSYLSLSYATLTQQQVVAIVGSLVHLHYSNYD